MTSFLFAGGLVLVVFFGIWVAMNEAKRRGRAEAEADALEAAKETEDAMDEITGQPRDPEKTKRELDEGTF